MFEVFGATFGATIAGCIALVATSGAAVYFFVKRSKDPVQQIQTVLYEEIHKVRELVTIRKPFHETVPFNDDRKIPKTNIHMPFSNRKLIMTYSGMIVCGCDLDKIRLEREGNKITVTVPHSRILDCYIDVHSLKVHYKDTGLLAKDFQIEEQNALIKANLETQQQKALQSGILNAANEEVRQELMSIITRRGLNQNFELEIAFRQHGDSNLLSAPRNFLRGD